MDTEIDKKTLEYQKRLTKKEFEDYKEMNNFFNYLTTAIAKEMIQITHWGEDTDNINEFKKYLYKAELLVESDDFAYLVHKYL